MDMDSLYSEEHGLWNGYGFRFKSILTHCLVVFHTIIVVTLHVKLITASE